jgi:hypothetical protein
MKLQEIKLDALTKGFVIGDVMSPNTPGAVQCIITKFDTDGLCFNSKHDFYPEEFFSIPTQKEFIRRSVILIDRNIKDRHAQNIKTCVHQHISIVVPNSNAETLACVKCMAKLGSKIKLYINLS